MLETDKQGLVKRQTLTDEEAAEVERLIDACNRYEGLHTRIGLDSFRKRPGDTTYDFLFYEAGQLVSYLYIDQFGRKEKELTGMVHPGYRRRGIFRALLEAAKEEWLPKGVQRFILVCEQSSASGQAFVKAMRAQRDFSEHEMVLGNFHERRAMHEGLQMRQAIPEDADTIIAILAADSGNVEEVGKWVRKLFGEPTTRFYLATLDGKPIGCLRLDDMGNQLGIYGFEVRMGYRGLGYGRQMLEQVIRTARSESQKPIMLDVDIDNTNAIGLYRSCGFEVKTTYDYYALEIS